ncbi:MAG: helix-turn-helix domain-containing protein [Candidatus Sumerlaeota bacterium]|nr:helix-turn-helix domain-containing protein [Candidatus Sumerlaeota bacterium]
MKFGAWIRAHRLRQNFSMDRVCQSVDLSKAYLSLIETGQKGPPKDGIIRQMAGTLALDEDDLLARAHRERYPEDVLALRSVVEDMRRALKDVRGARSALVGAGSGRRPSLPDKSQKVAQSLNESLKRLERLVPSDANGADELTTEIDDLRAEEREFLLSIVREIKRLRPRRGPQRAPIPAVAVDSPTVEEGDEPAHAETEGKAHREQAGNGRRGQGAKHAPRKAAALEWSI